MWHVAFQEHGVCQLLRHHLHITVVQRVPFQEPLASRAELFLLDGLLSAEISEDLLVQEQSRKPRVTITDRGVLCPLRHHCCCKAVLHCVFELKDFQLEQFKVKALH